MFYIIFIILVWQYRGKENTEGRKSELSKCVCAKVSMYFFPPFILECGGTQKTEPDRLQAQYTRKMMELMKKTG